MKRFKVEVLKRTESSTFIEVEANETVPPEIVIDPARQLSTFKCPSCEEYITNGDLMDALGPNINVINDYRAIEVRGACPLCGEDLDLDFTLTKLNGATPEFYLCLNHQQDVTWHECTEDFEGCEYKIARNVYARMLKKASGILEKEE